MWTRKHSLRFWDRILGFKISSVMLLGNQPRSWSCRRSPKIQPGREGRQKVTSSLQVAWAGPPSGVWGAGGRETRESGQPSQGPPALTPTDGNAQTRCIPQKLRGGVQPSWGARCPCTGRWRNRPTLHHRGSHGIDSGTHSQALNNLRLPHLWPGDPKGHPQKREASTGWWDGSWPRTPPSPSRWAALP